MGSFKSTILTQKAHALMAKLTAGTATSVFTKIKASDHDYSGLTSSQLEGLTSIEDIKQEVAVSEVKRINDASVKVTAALVNTALTTGYYIKTIGLYANDPDEGEILYSVTIAIESDWMPPFNNISSASALYELVTTVSNAENVSIEVDPNATVSITTFNEFKENVNSQLSENASQITLNAKYMQYINGIEYLVNYHTKLRLKQPTTTTLTGDSTMVGYGIQDANYLIQNLMRDTLNKYGVYNNVISNNAISGNDTTNWLNQLLDQDMATPPDLYIIRWGVNDGAYGLDIRYNRFISNLREGLTRIRKVKAVNEMSIILMMPVSTFDTPNGRDAIWYDSIYNAVKQVAKDFQCCFIDTYHYLFDSQNVTWGDDMFEDGRHVHPLETGSMWINDLLTPCIIPETLRTINVPNIAGANNKGKNNVELPNTYPLGVSLYRTKTYFPFDGMVTTFRHIDGMSQQINTPYDVNEKGVAVRYGSSTAWGEWIISKGDEITNIAGIGNPLRLASDLPTTYPKGISMYRSSSGFPCDGMVITFNHVDGIYLQINSSYDTTAPTSKQRTGYLNSWSEWF